MKQTLVIGASSNVERYSNMAVQLLYEKGYNVIALGNKKGIINNVLIETTYKAFKNIDTILLYINKAHQKTLYNYIISLKPRRIIFNPGTENDELITLATKNKILTQTACTIVLLKTNQY